MKDYLGEDFALTNQKKGGGRRKQSETKKKEKDTPAQTVAKAVTVSISTDAKMQIFRDTLE